MRTFTQAKWWGMPGKLHPRKLAKLGFSCLPNYVLQYTDAQSQDQTVQLDRSQALQ